MDRSDSVVYTVVVVLYKPDQQTCRAFRVAGRVGVVVAVASNFACSKVLACFPKPRHRNARLHHDGTYCLVPSLNISAIHACTACILLLLMHDADHVLVVLLGVFLASSTGYAHPNKTTH